MKFDAATLGAVLWPAFLGAAAADGLLFTLIDPLSMEWLGTAVEISRPLAYTVGFFIFWFIIVCASLLTLWLHGDAIERREARIRRSQQ